MLVLVLVLVMALVLPPEQPLGLSLVMCAMGGLSGET